MNSRPPPCEGDALPAELLPHRTPRCDVAWYVCHSGGRVKSFLRAGVADAGCSPGSGPVSLSGLAAGLPARSRRGPRALSSPATPSDPPWGAAPLAGCAGSFATSAVALAWGGLFRHFFAGSSATSAAACRQVPCAPDARRSSRGRRARIRASLRAGRASVPAGCRNAGSAFPRMTKKIGRAAPAGLGSREKKRYRSPLVSP